MLILSLYEVPKPRSLIYVSLVLLPPSQLHDGPLTCPRQMHSEKPQMVSEQVCHLFPLASSTSLCVRSLPCSIHHEVRYVNDTFCAFVARPIFLPSLETW